MPFTLSHSAAALPFLKSKRFSATGLIIGTMAPDFEYFFRLDVKGVYGHTLGGIFYFDVPVTIFLAFVFHNIAKRNLIDQLPVFFQAKFHELRESNFNQYFKGHWVAFIISAIIGTITHIFWDSFTHQHQYFVELLYPDPVLGGSPFALWKVLQYVSSVVGLAFLTWYIFRMKSAVARFNKPRLIYWVFLALIIAAIVAMRMQFKVNNEPYVMVMITFVAAFCLGITILGLVPFKKREL